VSPKAASQPFSCEYQQILARVLWILIAAFSVVLFAVALPIYFDSLLQEAQQYDTLLKQIHLFDRAYAAYYIVLEIAGILVYAVAGILIFWRSGGNWFTWLVSLTLVVIGVGVPPPIYELAGVRSAWYWPASLSIVFTNISTYVVLLCLFPDGRFVPRWTRLLAGAWVLRTVVNAFFPDSPLNANNWPAPFWSLEFLIWGAIGLAAQIYRYRHVSTLVQRQQTKWVVFGLVMGVVGFSIINVPSALLESIARSEFQFLLLVVGFRTAGFFLMIALPVTIGISVLHHRLWDLDFVTNQTLVYGLLTVLLGGLYLGLVRLLTLFVQGFYPENQTVAVFFSTIAITLAANPLRKRVQQVIDHTFYRTKLDYQELLQEVSTQLSSHLMADQLGILFNETLPQRLNLAGATLMVLDMNEEAFIELGSSKVCLPVDHALAQYFRETNRPICHTERNVNLPVEAIDYLDHHGIALSFPLQAGEKLIGIYNLMPRQPGIGCERFQVRSLTLLVQQAVLSLENVRLYQKLETYNETLGLAIETHTTELRQIKERVEAILNTNPDPILLLRSNGMINIVNPAFCKLFGYQRDDVFGWPLEKLIAGDDGEMVRKAVHFVATRGRPARLQTSANRSNDVSLDIDMALAPIKEEGEVVGLVCSLRDITPLKEAERMKDEFVSNVSHELRTPITSIKVYHQLLRTSPDKQDQYIEVLSRETERLESLIENILHLSRLDQDRVDMKLVPLDLNDLVETYVTDRTPIAKERGMSFSFEGEADLPLVQGDEAMLGEVLSILLTNALNYTPSGGRVTASTRVCRLPHQDCVVMTVQDTGPGIAPEEVPNVFDRFFRGTAGNQSGQPGTGLGLSIAKEIVERHQGWIKYIPGEGATFSVWLPVKN
jgi:two-component system phosphate regulon sensor histidine kinase PhoR